MTERFIIKDDRTVKDNLKGKGYVFSWGCDAEEVCKLLNTLYEDNQQLKSSNMEMDNYLARLEEKNEKLRKENRELEKFRHAFFKSMNKIIEKNEDDFND